MSAAEVEVEVGLDLSPVRPGEYLAEEYLKPLGISAYRLSKELHVPLTRINEILAGQRAITADTALRLGRYFGTSAQMWLNLQAYFETETARRATGTELEAITPFAWPPREDDAELDEAIRAAERGELAATA